MCRTHFDAPFLFFLSIQFTKSFSSINFYFARYGIVFDHENYLHICAHNKMIIQMEPYNEMKAQAAAHRHEENSLRVLLVMKAQALIKL